MTTPEKPKVFSPPASTSKRRHSFNESVDDKNESDSDALVIDFDDDDVSNKKNVTKRKSTTSNDEPEVDALEAKLAEITGEKPKPSKRFRSFIDLLTLVGRAGLCISSGSKAQAHF